MSGKYQYEIGDRSFEQRRLVFAQTLQIKEVFGELIGQLRDNKENLGGLTAVLGDQIPRFAAIVLREKGSSLKEKDLDLLTGFLVEEMDAEAAAGIVEDFLALTPISSDLTALTRMAGAIGGTVVTALKSLSASSPEGISASETTSSGTTDTTTSESGSKPESETLSSANQS